MKRRSLGFTLVEILVVITIIGILSTIIYANFGQGSAQSRDAQRKGDLRNLQNALELYKNDVGRYPAGCNGAGWSGQVGTTYDCPTVTDSQYIVGLAPKYISALPVDPKLNGLDSGYVYRTNAEGSVYKLVARNTVESEVVNYSSDFASCDMVADNGGSYSTGVTPWAKCPPDNVPEYITDYAESNKCAFAICNVINKNGSCNKAGPYQDLNNYEECKQVNISRSYAVWGGYGDPNDVTSNNSDELEVECLTEQVICDMPLPIFVP